MIKIMYDFEISNDRLQAVLDSANLQCRNVILLHCQEIQLHESTSSKYQEIHVDPNTQRLKDLLSSV